MHIEASMPSKTRFFVFAASIAILVGIFYFVDPRLTSIDPQKAAVQSANYAIHDKDYNKAIKILIDATKEYPRNADIRYTLGLAYAGLNHSQYMLSQYVEAVRIDPYHVPALLALGQNYLAANNYDSAAQILDRLQTACNNGKGCQERDMLAGMISREKSLQQNNPAQ
jgi:tetratricopeptide (TPR) repeat protein